MGIQNGTATLENSFIIIIIIIKQIQQFYSLVFNQIVIYISMKNLPMDITIHDFQNLREFKMSSNNG